MILVTDEEIHNLCCCLKAVQIIAEDGFAARMMDYFKEQELFSKNSFDERFIKSIKSVEQRYLAQLKKMGMPMPKKVKL